jgi:hypothetical protein
MFGGAERTAIRPVTYLAGGKYGLFVSTAPTGRRCTALSPSGRWSLTTLLFRALDYLCRGAAALLLLLLPLGRARSSWLLRLVLAVR